MTAAAADSAVDLTPIREMCARFDWVWDSLCDELQADLRISA